MKRTKTGFKLLCALLCCLLFGTAMGAAAFEVWTYYKIDDFRPGYDRELYGEDAVSGSEAAGAYRQTAVQSWYYSQKDKRNADEERKARECAKTLNPDSTNFRYRIYNLNGIILDSNTDSGEPMEELCGGCYLVGVNEQEGVLVYDTDQMVRSNNHDPNELLDNHYEYDPETRTYFTRHDDLVYRERMENWQKYCQDEAEQTALIQELQKRRGESPVNLQARNVPCADIEFEDAYYEKDTKTLCFWNEVQNVYVPASAIAAPEDNRTRLVGVMEWGLLKGLPRNDRFRAMSGQLEAFRGQFPVACVVFALLTVLCTACFVLLLSASGHKEGVEGIHVAGLHKCPLDLLCVAEGLLMLLIAWGWKSVVIGFMQIGLLDAGSPWQVPLACGVAAALAALAVLPFFTTWAVQVKDHSCWNRSFLGRLWKICTGIPGVFGALMQGLSVAPRLVLLATGYGLAVVFCALELGQGRGAYFLPLVALALVGLTALGWWLRGWEQVRTAAERIAAGELHHQMELKGLPWALRAHALQLNTISGGIQKAVAEQRKSDHFRTELITNVSHDLKTPLTSIISYVDLLKKREIPDEQAREYIEVLDRKSQRLKTLTEDLVEASKAESGVLSVALERLNAGLMLSQALGEYQERLEARGLEVVSHCPERPVWIQADGRHLWRILDNLLGNCAKYALPGTRVYMTLERREQEAVLSVKNISAQPLNVSAEELMERFVRGDRSRSEEGSGLGLSIAQSLATLQGMKLEVFVDGDLFKAELRAPAVKE